MENLTKSNVGAGAGIGSLAIVAIIMLNGTLNVTEFAQADESKAIAFDLSNHILQEAHPVAKERLNQILDKIDDIEKELKDSEKQMKLINKELSDLKLIICSNADFKCIIDLQ